MNRYRYDYMFYIGLAALLAVDASAHRYFHETHLLAYVVFLCGVYVSLPFRYLAGWFVVQVGFYAIEHLFFKNPYFSWIGVGSFSVWLVTLSVFREKEKKRKQSLLEKLRNYDKEEKILTVRSDLVSSELNLIEKKQFHRSGVIQKRAENIKNILEITQLALQSNTVALYFFDPIDEVFVLKESVSKQNATLEKIVAPEGVFLACLKEKDTVFLRSHDHVRCVNYYRDDVTIKTLVASPLYSNDFLQGVFIVDDVDHREIDASAMELIANVSKEIRTALEESETLQSYFNLKEELSAFYEASSMLNKCFRVQDVLETLLVSSKKIVHYDHAAVVLFDAQVDTNTVALEMGREKLGWEGEAFSCAQERGLISWVVKNKMSLSYADFRSRDSETPIFHKKWKIPNTFDSILLLPLYVSGEALGAVVFMAEAKNMFSKSVKKLLEVISLQASISMKNASMVGELERLATTDGLTGLCNHRTFQERLAQELSRSERHPTPFSLLLVDIDFFKKFNDEHGHPVGDFVLQQVAQVLTQAVRKVDLVARYGGEEFAILLLNADQQNASKMAQRIVESLRAKTHEHQGLELNVTASIGVATYPRDASTREQLIERADLALYESKHRGRNRATIYQSHFSKKDVKPSPPLLDSKKRISLHTT